MQVFFNLIKQLNSFLKPYLNLEFKKKEHLRSQKNLVAF